MFKPESIAKAELKGAFRRATDRYELFMKKVRTGVVKFGSRKNHLRYVEELVRCRGEFLLDQRVCHNHASWHFHSVMTSLDTFFQNIEGIGNVVRLVIDGWDSRKIMKGDKRGLQRLLTRLFVHEHFLIRAVQRFGLEGLKGLGKQVFPLFSYILRENLSFRLLGKSVHFVMPDYVLVAEKLPNSYGLVFKTILLRDRFSEQQLIQYQAAYQRMFNNKSDCVMFNRDTGHLISLHFTEQGINQTLLKESFWIRDIFTELEQCA